MTDDLVKRLRERSQYLWTTDKELLDNTLVKEAADRIEELEKAIIKAIAEAERPSYGDDYTKLDNYDDALRILRKVMTND